MTQAVQGVEREWRGKDGLACVFDGVGEPCNELNDMSGIEGGGRDEVGEREAVEDCIFRRVVPNDNMRSAFISGQKGEGVRKRRTDAQTDTGETISDGSNPGELGLVDGEVGA